MGRLGISKILKILLIIEVVVVLATAATYSRNFQDSWILEGLEVPFAVFMFTYAIYILIEKKIKWIIPFAVICRSAIVLIPNLKYDWFQGVAVDQHRHYRLAQDILDSGYIPNGRIYSGTPNMHLSFNIISLATNVSLLKIFEYFSIISWLVYPLVIYLIMKKLEPAKNSLPIKIALFISSIPVSPRVGSFLVIGTLFAPLLSLLFLWQLIKILHKRDWRDWAIAMIFIVALVATHSYTSIMLMITLLTMYLMIKLGGKMRVHIFNFRNIPFITLILIVIINLVWLSYQATNILESVVAIETSYLERLLGFETTTKIPIPLRFFELGIGDALKTVLVFHGGDMLLMFLTVIGVIVVVRKHKTQSSSLKIMSLYIISLLLYLVIGVFIFRFGENWYDRIVRLSLTLSPIFGSISLFYIFRRMHKFRNIWKTGFLLFFISLIVLATIEHYAYQPLIPPANTISGDLPSDEPIVYVGRVNSAYQRKMIEHGEKYIPNDTLIASDKVTQDQIIGLTAYAFSQRHLAYYYPFTKLIANNVEEKDYDYFFIHLPGKSGSFIEQAEIRSRSLIQDAITQSNILYTNGESYILGEPFMFD